MPHPCFAAGPVLQKTVLDRRCAREDRRESNGVEVVQARREAGKERAVIVEHGIVALLMQRGCGDAYLLARNASPAHRSAQHPVHAAVAVIGAAVAVLAERAAELAQHHYYGLAPRVAHALGKG